MITWIDNVNNFQIAKVQPQDVASYLPDFVANFSLALLTKVLFIKKACIEASMSLLTISFLDCNSVLVMLLNKVRVWLIISSFDLSSSCRYLI